MERNFDSAAALSFAWRALREYGVFIFIIFGIYILLLFAIFILIVVSQLLIIDIILIFIAILFIPSFPIIIISKMLYIYDIGKVPYRMLFLGLRDYFHFTLTFYILLLMTFSGLVIFVFPGLYIFSRFFIAPFLVLDRKWEGKGAIFESVGITASLSLLRHSAIFFLINFVGLILAGLGLFVSIPFSLAYITYIYRQVKLSPAKRVFEK
ncbi:MAG: hypothetical protein ACLFSQ_08415 [Candidatus Zixiibacteriota bacterium]